MEFFGVFAKKKAPSASLAKERLKIIVEHSRADARRPDFLDKMRRDILEAINKYVKIDIDSVDASINSNGHSEILEVNILLPDTVGIEESLQNNKRTRR